jgi:hypothetical protein
MLTRKPERTQPWGPFRLGTVAAEKASTPERGGWTALLDNTELAGVVLAVELVGVLEEVFSLWGGLAAGGTSTTTVLEV